MTALFVFTVLMIVLRSVNLLVLRKVQLRLLLRLQLRDLLSLLFFSHFGIILKKSDLAI